MIFLSMDSNSKMLSGLAPGLFMKTVHKTLPGVVGLKGCCHSVGTDQGHGVRLCHLGV